MRFDLKDGFLDEHLLQFVDIVLQTGGTVHLQNDLYNCEHLDNRRFTCQTHQQLLYMRYDHFRHFRKGQFRQLEVGRKHFLLTHCSSLQQHREKRLQMSHCLGSDLLALVGTERYPKSCQEVPFVRNIALTMLQHSPQLTEDIVNHFN